MKSGTFLETEHALYRKKIRTTGAYHMNTFSLRIAAALLLTLSGSLNAFAAQPEAAPATKTGAPAIVAEAPVLERFRTYTGPRTVDNLIRLFNPVGTAAAIKQNPDVVLSDGRTLVELTVTVKTSENIAPSFACIESRLISVNQPQAGTYKLVILPDTGSWKSAVVIQLGGSITTVGLSVAPPLSGGTDHSIKGFAEYLKNSDADPKLLSDLNSDGRSDYQDEYIRTANVLAARNADPHDPATRNKRARELTPVHTKP
jgi:hypothetical protein